MIKQCTEALGNLRSTRGTGAARTAHSPPAAAEQAGGRSAWVGARCAPPLTAGWGLGTPTGFQPGSFNQFRQRGGGQGNHLPGSGPCL